jgi:hypothetical protein
VPSLHHASKCLTRNHFPGKIVTGLKAFAAPEDHYLFKAYPKITATSAVVLSGRNSLRRTEGHSSKLLRLSETAITTHSPAALALLQGVAVPT